MEHEILVNEDGSLQAIYSDELAEMLTLGHATVRRVSSVEPWDVDGALVWEADLEACGGPVLGPFKRREDALKAEVAWLKAEMAQRRLEVKA